MRHFFIHKKDFDAILSKSGSGISTKKFLRMISFALIDILINFPILLAAFALEVSYMKIIPYTSWDFVHKRFSDVWIYPRTAISSSRFKHFLTMTSFATWSQCMMGFIFFFMFGLNTDIKSDYVKAFMKVKGMFHLKTQKATREYKDDNICSTDDISDVSNHKSEDSNIHPDGVSVEFSHVDLEASGHEASNYSISIPSNDDTKTNRFA